MQPMTQVRARTHTHKQVLVMWNISDLFHIYVEEGIKQSGATTQIIHKKEQNEMENRDMCSHGYLWD